MEVQESSFRKQQTVHPKEANRIPADTTRHTWWFFSKWSHVLYYLITFIGKQRNPLKRLQN